LEVGSFSYWFDKPWFHTEGRLAAVLLIPSSWGSQLGGHLHAIIWRFGTFDCVSNNLACFEDGFGDSGSFLDIGGHRFYIANRSRRR
jgi:hypothetical protein